MKKRLTILTLFLAFCLCAFAQNGSDNYWTIEDYNQYQNYSAATYVIYIDDVKVENTHTELGVFYEDKVVGSDKVSAIIDKDNVIVNYLAQVSVYGQWGQVLTFKLYDHEQQKVLNCSTDYTLLFTSPDDSHGSIDNPIRMDFYTNYIAQVGETKFETLAEAFDAVESSDDVITILKNAEGPGLVINKDVTIDFNGKTYTFTEGVGSIGTETNGFQILEGNNVTLENGGLDVAEESADKFYMLIQNYANLTIEDMSLDGTNLDRWSLTDGDSYVVSNNSGDVNISGKTTIKANNDGGLAFAFDACKYANYEAPVVTLGSEVVVEGRVELTGGQLYHNTKGIEALVKKSFQAGQAWGTISVPMANGADIPEPTAGRHDLYRYDEKDAQWEYYTGPDASNPYTQLELGHGYLYTNKESITLEFKGELNVEDVEMNLSYSHSTLPGFNLVGNPFTHEISKAQFMTQSGLTSGFYIVNANGALEARTDETMIAPMEAVMVKANANETMRIVKSEAKSRSNETSSYLAINVSNENYSDVAYVSFNEGLGLDKIAHRNANIPMVYVPVNGTDYAIAMMSEETTEIPVSFKAATMGEYTISVNTVNCEFDNIYLADRMTGERTNLNTNSYSFIATSNDNADRFIITMSNDNDNVNNNFAYISNGEIIINNIEGEGMVRILDVLGRPVAEYNVMENANITTASFTSGVYMIQMFDNSGVKVQKVVIE